MSFAPKPNAVIILRRKQNQRNDKVLGLAEDTVAHSTPLVADTRDLHVVACPGLCYMIL